MGKAILAWTDPRQVDAMFRGKLFSRTPRALPTLEALEQELAKVCGGGGLAYDREEAARQASATLFPQDVASRWRKARSELPRPAQWPPGALDRLVEGIGGDYWL